MELLTLINTYGIIFVSAIFIIIVENIIKDYIPIRLRPYFPLLLAIPLSVVSTILTGMSFYPLTVFIRYCLIDWAKVWILSIIGYDLVIRLFKDR